MALKSAERDSCQPLSGPQASCPLCEAFSILPCREHLLQASLALKKPGGEQQNDLHWWLQQDQRMSGIESPSEPPEMLVLRGVSPSFSELASGVW